ncbi:MAG TPA: YraN family protein [Castellaniella sp.]|uniref:YraN family protein n=1 Tax=Castellaniella sp. TaxID=1955812 RepID=UPI002F05E286
MDDTAYDTARQTQEQAARRRRRRRTRRTEPTHALQLGAGSDRQRAGHAAEQRASALLQASGLEVLATNLRCRAGEIDLVAIDGNTLVFVEVRHRNSLQFGGAAASVNRAKQTRLIRTALYFLPILSRHFFNGHPPMCRFDVMVEDGFDMRWIRDAFST